MPEEAEFNFAYVLLSNNPVSLDNMQPVVPLLLQMGWSNSPPFVCAAAETGCNIVEKLLTATIGSLAPYPLENITIPPTIATLLK